MFLEKEWHAPLIVPCMDCLAWYGINAACERSGNVWLRTSRSRIAGDYPLFVSAEYEGKEYISGLYGRLERRSAWILKSLLSRKIKKSEIDMSVDLGDSQIDALNTSRNSPVSLITGGPGTGKTTIAKIISDAHNRVLGLSPTGKGASRLSESIGHNCYTIHRAARSIMLGEIDISRYDLIIIDEAGMMGIDTLEMMLNFIFQSKTNARIIFLGDSGQLPSITPGRVIDELGISIPSTRLNVTYRFSDADIGEACESARNGAIHEEHTDHYSMLEGSITTAFQEYMRLVKKFSVHDVRLITYHREDANEFNRMAKGYLKGIEPPIVCIRNNYREDVFNGQCGVAESSGKLRFGDKRILPGRIQWRYSYASTCHTAQGGQWEGVVVWIPSARFISKEWLLTALSRAVSDLSVVVRDAVVTESCLSASKPASKRISLLGAFTQERATWVS